jgi:hypothetical protein
VKLEEPTKLPAQPHITETSSFPTLVSYDSSRSSWIKKIDYQSLFTPSQKKPNNQSTSMNLWCCFLLVPSLFGHQTRQNLSWEMVTIVEVAGTHNKLIGLRGHWHLQLLSTLTCQWFYWSIGSERRKMSEFGELKAIQKRTNSASNLAGGKGWVRRVWVNKFGWVWFNYSIENRNEESTTGSNGTSPEES